MRNNEHCFKPLDYNSMIGNIIGKLTIVGFERIGSGKSVRYVLNCACECGNKKTIRAASIRSGNTKSCGCIQKETMSYIRSKHKMSHSPEHRTWAGIKSRCFNPKTKCYDRYGGRGITMYEDWKNSFEAFYSYVGPKPTPKHTIDRIDVNGNYEPGNVRWITAYEQAANKRNTRYLAFNGKTMRFKEWAQETGISLSAIRNRFYRGLSIDQILTAA